MVSSKFFHCVAFSFLLAVCASEISEFKVITQQEKDWWQTAQFYQIYPRSFKDSDGDGIGDLKGITSKLEYLKDLGVTAVWLSPIFKSPMVDFGYDISDFFDIQPEFGTLEDFRALIKRAKELNLKVLLDFVPNHSSDQNVWFQKSVKRERGYENYYVWHDGKINKETGKREPPTNWLQYFRGSAWEWNDERQQYYLHQFTVQQPDLNYRNPDVVEQMKRVLRYWLHEGIDGFRCDAVPTVFEIKPDANGQYPDEAVSGTTSDSEDRNYLRTDYVENQPETVDMTYQWRQVMDDHQRIYGGETRVLLIETASPPWFTMQLYGNSTVNRAHLPFNFNLIFEVRNNGFSAKNIKTAIDSWLKNMPAGRTANWVIGNHDQLRVPTRYGVSNIDAMNMLVMLLPGASVTYQGEELGMTDGDISWEETVDPWGCNANPEIYKLTSRDPARTPFQWTGERNAGFSTGPKTWLPLAADYQTINVETELKAARSHLKIYRKLVQLRQLSKTLRDGNTKYDILSDDVLVVKRSLTGFPSILLVANLGDEAHAVNLQKFDARLDAQLYAEIVSVDSPRTETRAYDVTNLQLNAGEALVLSNAHIQKY